MNAATFPPIRIQPDLQAQELEGLQDGSHPYSRTCNCDRCFETWLALPEPTAAEREAMARAFSAALWPAGKGELLTDYPVTFPDLDEARPMSLQELSKGQHRFNRERRG